MVGVECVWTAVRRASATSLAIRQNYEYGGYIPYIHCVQSPFLSALDDGFYLGSASSLGCETLHLSQHVSFVPRRLLDMITTRDDKIWDDIAKTGVQTFEEHKSNAPFAVYRPMLPIIVIGSEGVTI